MSNQHSYALVLSQRQRLGLTEFTDKRRSTPRAQIYRQAQHAVDSLNSCLQLPAAAPQQPRVRLRHDPEKERTTTARARYELGEQSFYIEEEKPQEDIKPASSRASIYDGSDYQDITRPITPPPWLRERSGSPDEREYIDDDTDTSYRLLSREESSYTIGTPGLKQHDVKKLPARPSRGRTYSNDTEDTAIWNPETSKGKASSRADTVVKTASTGPLRPLTPPLTPRLRKSWETFSLDNVERSTEDVRNSWETSFDYQEPEPPSVLPIDPRGLVATPPESNHSNQSLRLCTTKETIKTQAQASPARPSLPERESSRNAPTYPAHHDRSSSYASDDMLVKPMPTSPTFSLRRSIDSLDLDADLSPLPPDLSTDPEFTGTFPWLDEPSIPAVNRVGRHGSMDMPDNATISSFDSAAPPPISLGMRPSGGPRSKTSFDPRYQHRHQQQDDDRTATPTAYSGRISVTPTPPKTRLPLISLQQATPESTSAKTKRKLLTKSPFSGSAGITTTTCSSSPPNCPLPARPSAPSNALQKKGYPKAAPDLMNNTNTTAPHPVTQSTKSSLMPNFLINKRSNSRLAERPTSRLNNHPSRQGPGLQHEPEGDTKVVKMAGQEVRLPAHPYQREYQRERERVREREREAERERELKDKVQKVWGAHLPGGRGDWGG